MKKSFCQHCGAPLDEGAKFCASCGASLSENVTSPAFSESVNEKAGEDSSKNTKESDRPKKKKGMKRWLIIAGVLLLLAVLLANIGGGNHSTVESKPSSATMQKTEPASAESAEPVHTKNDADNAKQYTRNYTALELGQLAQDNEFAPFTLSEKAAGFLAEHDNLFPANSKIDDMLIDKSLDYRKIEKNASKHGDRLMELPIVQIAQIWEKDHNEEYITILNVTDENMQSYIVFYYGELADIYEDDFVSICGLPIGISTFENTLGGATNVVVLFGAKIQKTDFDIANASTNTSTNASTNAPTPSVGNTTNNAPRAGAYDDIAGTYIDEGGSGIYMFVGYNDSSKTDAYIQVALPIEDITVTIHGREGNTVMANDYNPAYGSEPSHSVDLYIDSANNQIMAEVYISEYDYYEQILFVPSNNSVYSNPFYVG